MFVEPERPDRSGREVEPEGTAQDVGEVVTAAIVDRLLHSAAVLNIRDASYRMRAYAAQQKLKGGGAMVGLAPRPVHFSCSSLCTFRGPPHPLLGRRF